jgi:hemerythrin
MKNWAEVFSTGIDALDQDHKRLLRVAEMIAERVDNPDTDPKQWPFLVREGLKYMEGYYDSHIHREEAYMRQINYPHYETHKQVHDELEQTVSRYIAAQIETDDCKLDDVLELLGAAYGWQMIHIAMDDMAIVGKGALASSVDEELNDENVIRELNAMLGDLLHFEPRTRIVSGNYEGDGMNSAACQEIHYDLAGMELTLVLGMEESLMRHAIETFWEKKALDKNIDRAHRMLLQWCLTSFVVGFWRSMIGHFSHERSCMLKSVVPLDIKDTRQVMRGKTFNKSVLYETAKGRFFVACAY